MVLWQQVRLFDYTVSTTCFQTTQLHFFVPNVDPSRYSVKLHFGIIPYLLFDNFKHIQCILIISLEIGMRIALIATCLEYLIYSSTNSF